MDPGMYRPFEVFFFFSEIIEIINLSIVWDRVWDRGICIQHIVFSYGKVTVFHWHKLRLIGGEESKFVLNHHNYGLLHQFVLYTWTISTLMILLESDQTSLMVLELSLFPVTNVPEWEPGLRPKSWLDTVEPFYELERYGDKSVTQQPSWFI